MMQARHLASVSAVASGQWDALFPGEAEGHAYYLACEATAPPAFTFSAIGVFRGDELIAAAPVFKVVYRLDMALQGFARRISDFAARVLPRLLSLPLLALGSPLAERCHIGFLAGLSAEERDRAADLLLAALEARAKELRVGLIGVKDLALPDDAGLRATLVSRGFARMNSLPVATLDTVFPSEDAYIAALSANERSALRRKIKKNVRDGIRIEHRADLAGIEPLIAGLYADTRKNSDVDYGDFEDLQPPYFAAVLRALGPRAFCFLYWLGDDLLAFNLILLDDTRMIVKYIGMLYPRGRDHNLYFVSWMHQLRYCLAHGLREMQTGQTAYRQKIRLGSRLVPGFVYFRHSNRLFNLALRFAARFTAFDKMDPDLKGLAQ